MERAAALVGRWPAENWRRLTSRICGERRREIYLRRPLILWPAFASHQIIILFHKNLGDLFASARALFICVSLYYCNHASVSSPAFTNRPIKRERVNVETSRFPNLCAKKPTEKTVKGHGPIANLITRFRIYEAAVCFVKPGLRFVWKWMLEISANVCL